ncbi:FAD-linked oxidoreductase-like protein [Russula earlei]|uniref:FAD-linked oxidoreductase-like protein n=1 Tax=Russula earlei TaxID=71964 RepID=A0ACC0UIG5_9AGAM|nr:FAD-linked oxidoreductase-like protein [Russula earlei]
MLARLFRRQVSLTPLYLQRCNRVFGHSAVHSFRRPRISVVGGGALTASLIVGLGYTLNADVPPPSKERTPTPLPQLISSYVVYSICSIPGLVDASPALLAFCTSIPGLRQLTEAFVRVTFFTQFVGGDTAHACLPLIRRLRADNKGALLAYSVEVDETETTGGTRSTSEPVHQHIVQELLRSIDVAADFEESQARETPGSGRRTWVAIKLSALLPNPAALFHLSAYLSSLHTHNATLYPGCPCVDDLAVLKLNGPPPGSPLTAQDLVDLRELNESLIRLCTRARARDVRVIVDAEYSWYQPAVDSISFSLMREFNRESSSPMRWLPWPFSRSVRPRPPPLIYVTCQAYLRRTPEYLVQCLRDAASNQYALGIKLVRGAYHEQEVKADSRSLSFTTGASWPPVFTNKVDTDECYDAAAAELIRAVANVDDHGPRVGVLFGSHNAESCAKVLDALVDVGLATREDGAVKLDDQAAERVNLAQLYGMSDSLTDRLATLVKTPAPFVIKYVPYGALPEVMPYLSRRAIENKSVLGDGHATKERQQAFDALWQRLFGSSDKAHATRHGHA